jgi:DNA-binding transcriptional ArsR family regulator
LRHEEIAEQLRLEIKRGSPRFSPTLPSLNELSDHFGASRVTVRDALAVLEREGLVEMRQGRGTSLTPLALRMRRGAARIDPEEQFRAWKIRSRVPDDFPGLKGMDWKDLNTKRQVYFNAKQLEKIRNIFSAAAARASERAHVAVYLSPGHGCTTLFNYIFWNLTNEEQGDPDSATPSVGSTASLIPVRLTWSRLGNDPERFWRMVEASIREDVFRELSKARWGSLLSDVTYGRLIGAIRPGVDDPQIEEHREKLEATIRKEFGEAEFDPPEAKPDKVAEKLAEIAPLAKQRVGDLLALLDSHQIRTLLMVDLSPDRDHGGVIDAKPLEALVGVIKDLHDQMPGNGAAPLREMYFLDRSTQAHIRSLFSRDPYEIEFPPFTAGDFLGVLSRHYPTVIHLDHGGQLDSAVTTMELAAVVSPGFMGAMKRRLTQDGREFKDAGLVELSRVMRQMILEMTSAPWEDIPYHLVPPEAL